MRREIVAAHLRPSHRVGSAVIHVTRNRVGAGSMNAFVAIAPQQLTLDNDIIAAANAGEIILMPTAEVYRCSVIGSKK